MIWLSATLCFCANICKASAFCLGVLLVRMRMSMRWNPFQARERKLSVPVSARSAVIHLSLFICGSVTATALALASLIGASSSLSTSTFQLPSARACDILPPVAATLPTYPSLPSVRAVFSVRLPRIKVKLFISCL